MNVEDTTMNVEDTTMNIKVVRINLVRLKHYLKRQSQGDAVKIIPGADFMFSKYPLEHPVYGNYRRTSAGKEDGVNISRR